MTQEDKELLLKDLCSRLPYGVKVEVTILETNKVIVEEFDYMWLGILYSENPHHMIKPYLRPMSSMTEEEEGRYNLLQGLSHLAEQHWTANDGNVFDILPRLKPAGFLTSSLAGLRRMPFDRGLVGLTSTC